MAIPLSAHDTARSTEWHIGAVPRMFLDCNSAQEMQTVARLRAQSRIIVRYEAQAGLSGTLVRIGPH
ncbi:hypothetical protein BWP39_00255 [Paraburkholderia acidicola]|uniref:Uncharacterized protein n=1 Tax=Paraburkholderia acidicola TaxID=1912599 RepID=A0A2A4F697_9BURK|nr:hypothetical protein BWP39_00255 [Paraburkholderia acidicola]